MTFIGRVELSKAMILVLLLPLSEYRVKTHTHYFGGLGIRTWMGDGGDGFCIANRLHEYNMQMAQF